MWWSHVDAMARPALDLLFVGPYPPSHGGTAASLLQLTLALDERGHRVRVLAPIPPEAHGYDRELGPRIRGVRLHRYEVPYYYQAYWRVPFDEHYRSCERQALRRALPPLLAARRPDVLVVGHEALAPTVLDLLEGSGLPSVLLVRGSPTWKIVTGDYPEREGRGWLEAYARADRVVAVARYLAEGLRRLGLARVDSIPNHVDLDAFAPRPRDPGLVAELGLGPRDVVVVHASKLEARKRPLDIVASAALALRTCPFLAYVVAGEGPLRAKMEDEAARLGLSTRFRFPGPLPYERMPELFGLADLVVQPSEGEGLARVYLEAMACGRPLLASDIPAAREIVRHGENGLLHETGSAEALASATVAAARDPELRDQLGRAARASVAPHSLELVTDRFTALFGRVCGTRG